MKGWTERDIQNLGLEKTEQAGFKTRLPLPESFYRDDDNCVRFLSEKDVKPPKSQAKSQPEFTLQKQLCQFVRNQYPNVFFLSDTVASVRLTEPQQMRNKAIQNSNFHCPDLMILEPGRGFDGKIQYHGLFLELKVKSPFKKDGTLLKDEHLQKQFDTLARLNERGYKALFVWSFDAAIKVINEYFKR